jgi:hypothetical protein
MSDGITKKGKSLEDVALSILAGSRKPQKTKECDNIWPTKIGEKTIEIRSEWKKNKGNQTRPYKDCVFVLGVENSEDSDEYEKFKVIPASVIMEDCLSKAGQHAIQAFICYNFSGAKRFDKYTCLKNEVPAKIKEAKKIDLENEKYQEILKKIREEIDRQLRFQDDLLEWYNK